MSNFDTYVYIHIYIVSIEFERNTKSNLCARKILTFEYFTNREFYYIIPNLVQKESAIFLFIKFSSIVLKRIVDGFFFFKTKKFQCSTSSWVNINTFKNNLFTKSSFFDWKYVRCLKKNITFEILLVSTFIPYTKFSSFRDIYFFFFFFKYDERKIW